MLGSLLVFGAVCCEAAYSLLGKRLTADLSPIAIAVWAAVGAAVVFAPFAVVQAIAFDWSTPTAEDWLAVLWWGAGTMGLGSVLWFHGIREVPGTTASGFSEPVPPDGAWLDAAEIDLAELGQNPRRAVLGHDGVDLPPERGRLVGAQ